TLCLGLVTTKSFLLALPIIACSFFGRPTMDGNTWRGASSPEKPAFTIPEPLSQTMADCSSSDIVRNRDAIKTRSLIKFVVACSWCKSEGKKPGRKTAVKTP
ncbi:uncharacterized protein Tco025E_09802, partial [Trypanosoma conorhini]